MEYRDSQKLIYYVNMHYGKERSVLKLGGRFAHFFTRSLLLTNLLVCCDRPLLLADLLICEWNQ
jgi:hypothetical protein